MTTTELTERDTWLAGAREGELTTADVLDRFGDEVRVAVEAAHKRHSARWSRSAGQEAQWGVNSLEDLHSVIWEHALKAVKAATRRWDPDRGPFAHFLSSWLRRELTVVPYDDIPRNPGDLRVRGHLAAILRTDRWVGSWDDLASVVRDRIIDAELAKRPSGEDDQNPRDTAWERVKDRKDGTRDALKADNFYKLAIEVQGDLSLDASEDGEETIGDRLMAPPTGTGTQDNGPLVSLATIATLLQRDCDGDVFEALSGTDEQDTSVHGNKLLSAKRKLAARLASPLYQWAHLSPELPGTYAQTPAANTSRSAQELIAQRRRAHAGVSRLRSTVDRTSGPPTVGVL